MHELHDKTNVIMLIKQQKNMSTHVKRGIIEVTKALKYDKLSLKDLQELEDIHDAPQGSYITGLIWLQRRGFLDTEILENGGNRGENHYYSLRKGVGI